MVLLGSTYIVERDTVPSITESEKQGEWVCQNPRMPEKLCFNFIFERERRAGEPKDIRYWTDSLPHQNCPPGSYRPSNGHGILIEEGPNLLLAWLIVAFAMIGSVIQQFVWDTKKGFDYKLALPATGALFAIAYTVYLMLKEAVSLFCNY